MKRIPATRSKEQCLAILDEPGRASAGMLDLDTQVLLYAGGLTET